MNRATGLMMAAWIALFVTGCDSRAATELKGFESELRAQALAAVPGEVIDLRGLAPDYDWRSLVVIGPYPDGGEFERVAGFSWTAPEAGLAGEEANVVAFVRDHEVLAHAIIRGDVYFLAEEDTSILVPRDDAFFQVVLEDDSVSRRLDLVPAASLSESRIAKPATNTHTEPC